MTRPPSPEKPLFAALKGYQPASPPIWIMRQAGRYLPEYREVRKQAGSFLDLCLTPELAEEVTLQPIRRYGFDGAILFSDILVVPWALGQKVAFKEGVGPVLDPIRGLVDLQRLVLAGMTERLAPVYEAVGRLHRSLPRETTLIGFAGAPWTVATYMVEGGTSRDHGHTKAWAYGDPHGFDQLIQLVAEATVEHLAAQIEAGAEVVQIFDTWAGVLSHRAMLRLCLEPVSWIAARLKDRFPDVPVIVFPRGTGEGLSDFAGRPEIGAVSLDSSVSLRHARALQRQVAVQGNLDPYLLAVGGNAMADEVKRLLDTLGRGPYVFNLGHGVLPSTPPEHVHELVALVRGWHG